MEVVPFKFGVSWPCHCQLEARGLEECEELLLAADPGVGLLGLFGSRFLSMEVLNLSRF